MNLAIFQPDIPQNTGAIIRNCACFNVNLDIIIIRHDPLNRKRLAMHIFNFRCNLRGILKKWTF